MSKYTENLNLYEKEPDIDGDDTFNITTMMNNNWDKIDSATGDLSDLTTTEKDNLVGAINELDSDISSLATVPVDMVLACPSSTVPSGFLECDGSSLLRSQYQALFNIIGTTYGNADSTHFNLPNFKGAFLRGYGTQSSGHSSGNIGSLQGDDVKPHVHPIPNYNGNRGYAESGGGSSDFLGYNSTKQYPTLENSGTETRPVNYAVKWIIKY